MKLHFESGLPVWRRAPVFYPITAIPEELRPWIMANPLTFIIEQAREVLIGGRAPNWSGTSTPWWPPLWPGPVTPGSRRPERGLPMCFDPLLLAGESQTVEFKTSFDKTTVESLVAFASLRNKLVAEAFYLTGSIEKYGSGFIRIRKALRDYPEIEFEIKEFAGGVMATFAQRERVNVGVNVGVNSLLAYVESHPGQRAGEMAVAFNFTQRTIERRLKQLKEKGLIEFRGAPKTGGYYRT